MGVVPAEVAGVVPGLVAFAGGCCVALLGSVGDWVGVVLLVPAAVLVRVGVGLLLFGEVAFGTITDLALWLSGSTFFIAFASELLERGLLLVLYTYT